jgi:hypothetical protein
METPMYEGRKELEKAHPDHFTDYTRRAFVDNHEIKHFMSNFTKKDKIKLFFAPFSFGSTFRMPFWKVENRIFGFFDKIWRKSEKTENRVLVFLAEMAKTDFFCYFCRNRFYQFCKGEVKWLKVKLWSMFLIKGSIHVGQYMIIPDLCSLSAANQRTAKYTNLQGLRVAAKGSLGISMLIPEAKYL